MTPTRNWKRFLAVSCSHGPFADPTALKAILDFKAAWKPHKTIHLGDFLDLAALRTGAKGGPDEAACIKDDFESGFAFLRDLRPNLLFFGNHEARLTKLAGHHNAVISFACGQALGDIQALTDSIKCELVTAYHIKQPCWKPLGDAKLLHGFMFNEMAIRDHAETFGKCIIGHLHTVGQAIGRRLDSPTAYCVGTLLKLDGMGYAAERRATLKWKQGFAWGEYCNDEAMVWTYQRPESGWRLPRV